MIINTINYMGNSTNAGLPVKSGDAALSKALKLYVQMLLNKSEWTRQLIEELRQEEWAADKQQILTEIVDCHESGSVADKSRKLKVANLNDTQRY